VTASRTPPFLGALGWHGRLAIAAILTTIIFMAAIAMVAFTLYQRVALDLVIERDARLVYLSAYRVREELAKLASGLDSLSRDPHMYGMIPADQTRVIRADAPALTMFDGGVVILDSRGRVRTAVPDRLDLKGDDWSHLDVFRAHLTTSGMAVSDAFPGGPQGADTVAISVPLLDAEREFVGVLAGMFDVGSSALSPLYASILRLRIGQSGSTYVVDGADRILYDSELGATGVMIAERGPVGFDPTGGARAWRTRDAAGNDIIAASAPVPGTRWTLISEEDARALTSGVLGYRRLLYTLMTLGIALPAAGVALMVQRGWTSRDPAGGEWWAGTTVNAPLPPRIAGWVVAAESQAGAGGAEAIDFLVEPDGNVLLSMTALSGRRATAELLSTARAAVRIAAVRERDPERVMDVAREALQPLLTGDEIIRGLFMRLDPVTGEYAYAARDYPSPVPTVTGTRGTIATGACMIVTGPGLLTVRNEAGEEFGRERLDAARTAGTASDEGIADTVVEAVCAFAGRGRLSRATWSFVVLARGAQAGSRTS
jgi:hypothetical protein